MTSAATIARYIFGRRRKVLSNLKQALAVRRQRRALRDLPPEVLRDIGLTRDEALSEAGRPIWDVPRHWLS
jgi:uncharacterized protein YjiS (DUF1127 family)